MCVCVYADSYQSTCFTSTNVQILTRDGQLGLGPVTKEKKSPMRIKELPEIAHLASCGSHSVAVLNLLAFLLFYWCKSTNADAEGGGRWTSGAGCGCGARMSPDSWG